MQTGLIIAVIIGIVALLFGYKALIRYTQKVYAETGYNPFSGGNLALMFGILALPIAVGLLLVHGSTPQASEIIPMVLAMLLPIVVLAIRNRSLNNAGRIVFFTILQIIGGLLIVVFLIFKVVFKASFSMAGVELGDRTVQAANVRREVDQKNVQPDFQRRQADHIAQEQGFRDYDDAKQSMK
ncbi:hypothetical protein [Caproiciproducens sp. CPB-2]|uniref:hypothetical protein n=1 Tax=Caproiciproducens sp. CPB-2 TaxID=3030017 RepID=UPI0023DB941A|nr:hypothetical protein [Caproiciproducens sp. CPB-2]MDF1494479.1 hypothetical protein [Caproiciproducens sp. CPB-2]